MKDTYFWAMFVLQILTLIIINFQYYVTDNEIEAIFNFERATFILGMVIFAEIVHQKRR